MTTPPGDARTLRRRYLSALAQAGLLVVVTDASWSVLAGRYAQAGGEAAQLAFFDIVLALVSGLWLWRPVRAFLRGAGVARDEALRRATRLPSLSMLFSAATNGGLLALSLAAIAHFQRSGAVAVPRHSESWFVICAIGFVQIVGLPAYYTFFLVTNAMGPLRAHLATIGASVTPGRDRLAIRLALSLLPLVFIPMINIVGTQKLGEDAASFGVDASTAMIRTVLEMSVASVFAVIVLAGGFTRPIELLVRSTDRVRAGDYDHVTPVLSSDELGVLADRFNQMVTGLRERERIRDLFGRFVAHRVADLVIDDPSVLAGQERVATLLFTDIANYTQFAERLPAADVVRTLNEYFSFVVEVVDRHGGIVNKFIGDAVFAIFNAPIEDAKHAENAVCAALAIMEGSSSRTFGPGGRLETRIGISTGTVVAGAIGGKDRLEYTVIGDEVNVAARLEQAGKTLGGGVLVGKGTWELTKDLIEYEALGPVSLKGKEKVVEVYRALRSFAGKKR